MNPKRIIKRVFTGLVKRVGSQRMAAEAAGVSVCVVSQVLKGVYPFSASLHERLKDRLDTLRKMRLTEEQKPFAYKPRTDRERIWQSIRIMRRFTLNDLVSTAEVTYDMARIYVAQLRRTGLVVLVSRHGNQAGSWAQYRLVRDCGPVPPKCGGKTDAH
ncbi:MAG TPA: hypothetical protein PKM25_09915 [Candidatus Ozemobacteraceae bacterium]|nr:hypothetical protein [Candidatus Ozemobacteraceae bacterium]